MQTPCLFRQSRQWPWSARSSSSSDNRGTSRRPPRLGASRARQTRLDSQSLAVTTAIPFTFLRLAFSSVKEMRGLPTSLE